MAGLVANLTLNLRALGLSALGTTTRGLSDIAKTAPAAAKGMEKFGAQAAKAFDLGAKAELFAGAMDRIRNASFGAVEAPIEDFKNFESAMARAKSKMDEVSTKDFAAMKKAALDAGATTAFSATQAADGLGEMAAAGFTVEQQIAALPKVLQLAQAGEVGVGEATKIAASAMAQFGLKAQDVGSIGDILLKASNASTIGLTEIAESMKYVGPIASAAGLSLKSTAGFVALLGNAGIEASSAGTALRGMIASMAAPSSKSKKALAELGISTAQLAEGAKDPMKALKLLGERFDAKHYTDAQRLGVIMKVFGRETSAAVASLIQAGSKAGENGTAFENMAKAMDNSQGAMQRAADTLGDTTANKLKRLTAQVDGLKIAAGEKMAPAMLQLAEDAKPWLTSMGVWIEKHPTAIAGFAKMAIVTAGVATALKAAALSASLFSLASPLLAPLSAIKRLSDLAEQGQTWNAQLLRMEGGLTKVQSAAVKVFGAAGAFAAGYEIGGMIDGLIGKLFELRGGLLSTELALRAGESAGTKATVSTVSDVVALEKAGKGGEGYQTEQQRKNWEGFMDVFTFGAYSRNAQRNRDEAAANAGANPNYSATSPSADAQPFRADGGFNAVTGQIEVKVTDDRVRVTTRGSGPVQLRTGSTPTGAR